MNRPLRPYVDYGQPGTMRYRGRRLQLVKEPPTVPLKILTLQALRRHNSLEPALQPTNRTMLRWSEGLGVGLPNPDAEIRETHFDPLPPDLYEKVNVIVEESPWEYFAKRWYRSDIDRKKLAEDMCISRVQLYADWRACLWFLTGSFQASRIYG